MENWDIKRFARGLNANATGVLVLILLEAPTSAIGEEAKEEELLDIPQGNIFQIAVYNQQC